MYYPQYNINKLEENIIRKWTKEKTFNKILNKTFTNKYIFFDGPPFANGLPHYGHLLTGFIKDVFCRYHTMQGKKVSHRFGWDCHGLPAEMYIEKKLNISGKVAIKKFGIKKFNKKCKESVLKYRKKWKNYIKRQARWIDFDNDYKTMDLYYMESVLWAFKELYDKKLIYQEMRVMPYSWACQTPVSDFETRIDNSYREKKSKTVTLALKLNAFIPNINNLVKNLYLTIWTTTPWTLPSNLAIAINKNIKYVIVKKNEEGFILAANLLKKYANQLGNKIIENFSGKNLINFSYQPPFFYFKKHHNAFKILHDDFVTIKNGTGIVHIAPGFGENDQILCYKNNINIICPIDEDAKFKYPISDFKGMHVLNTNDKIIQYLENLGLFIKTDQYIHKYPHCWRTDTPLIYKAVSSWYLKVTNIKNKMIINNTKINWIPKHIKNGLFGKWLKNAKDWSISRNRFWGCPIPVWLSNKPQYPCIKVYGTIKDLERAFKTKISDLHRPFIDTLIKSNPNDHRGISILKRAPEVLDCWFESGAMPFAQIHYPFKNKNHLKEYIPADFIVEYQAQTRGWFYTMMILSTALFNKPPFLNCICHGVILGYGGQKLSKRLKNYPDLKELFERHGADAMRLSMLSSPVMYGQDLIIDINATNLKKIHKKIIKPLCNSIHFYKLYYKNDNIKITNNINSTNILDKYLISKLSYTIYQTKKYLDCYNTIKAISEIHKFIESLNNWYIRRSRQRFWRHETNSDKQFAYNTLYFVIKNFCTLSAPIMPLISEAIYLSIIPKTTSVHLQDFPTLPHISFNKQLINNMEKVRNACKAALRIRNNQKIKIRQPLSEVFFIGVTNNYITNNMKTLILDEINAKKWINLKKNQISKYADFIIKINFPILAKRLPKKIKTIVVKKNNWKMENGKISIFNIILNNQEYQFNLKTKRKFQTNCSILSTNDSLVFLNTTIPENLKYEGLAKEIIRIIQQIRKEMKLNIKTKITIHLSTNDHILNEVKRKYINMIEKQTLSILIEQKMKNHQYQNNFKLNNNLLIISIY